VVFVPGVLRRRVSGVAVIVMRVGFHGGGLDDLVPATVAEFPSRNRARRPRHS
jgi:hypothetical protein